MKNVFVEMFSELDHFLILGNSQSTTIKQFSYKGIYTTINIRKIKILLLIFVLFYH